MGEVKSAGIGSIMEKIQLFIFNVTVSGRDHTSQNRISLVVIFLKPEAKIIRHRLDNLLTELSQIADLGIFFSCNAVNDSNGNSFLRLSSNFKGTEYGSIFRHIKIFLV